MTIKRLVKFSFILIAILLLLMFFANSIILYQTAENNLFKQNIFKLVTIQENMNSLLKDILSANSKDRLEQINDEFIHFEKEFEKVKDLFINQKKDDFLDLFIKDLNHDQKINTNLNYLYDNEKTMEISFAKIFENHYKNIDLKTLFEELYPNENKLRKDLENEILKTKNLQIVKQFGDIKYYSKEVFFQHKNQDYLDKLIKEIEYFQWLYYSPKIDDYISIVKKIAAYILQIETLSQDESNLQNEILNIVGENKKIYSLIEKDIDKLSNDFINNIYLLMLGLLILNISFIIGLAYHVNKNVALGIDHIESEIELGLIKIKSLNKEIEDTQKEVIFTMGAIGESRSKETGNHVKRVAEYSKLLALKYGLSNKEAEMLKQASPMHDIGKVAITDSILNKPGRFNDSEREIMNTHAKLGFDMLKHSNRPLLKMASIVSYEHHEKWDGSGYPEGKIGENIHIFGRITALADVFDALGSERCYKKAWEDEKIFQLFKDEKGKHFDPILVDIFFEYLDEFLKIRDKFKD